MIYVQVLFSGSNIPLLEVFEPMSTTSDEHK